MGKGVRRRTSGKRDQICRISVLDAVSARTRLAVRVLNTSAAEEENLSAACERSILSG